MKITYTGRQVELAPAQLKKLEAKFAKVGKLLDGKREREAHVMLSLERHLHHAEITVNYLRSSAGGHRLERGPVHTRFTPPSRSSRSRRSRNAPSGATPSARPARPAAGSGNRAARGRSRGRAEHAEQADVPRQSSPEAQADDAR